MVAELRREKNPRRAQHSGRFIFGEGGQAPAAAASFFHREGGGERYSRKSRASKTRRSSRAAVRRAARYVFLSRSVARDGCTCVPTCGREHAIAHVQFPPRPASSRCPICALFSCDPPHADGALSKIGTLTSNLHPRPTENSKIPETVEVVRRLPVSKRSVIRLTRARTWTGQAIGLRSVSQPRSSSSRRASD